MSVGDRDVVVADGDKPVEDALTAVLTKSKELS
jgi:hypothetical protein